MTKIGIDRTGNQGVNADIFSPNADAQQRVNEISAPFVAE
jgi:hypothetical protein